MLLFIVKHYVCDFVLQNSWQAIGKAKTKGWILPLLVHSVINATGTAIILLVFGSPYWLVFGLSEIAVHFIIDRIKTKVPVVKDSRAYWLVFGADQTLHLIWLYLVSLSL